MLKYTFSSHFLSSCVNREISKNMAGVDEDKRKKYMICVDGVLESQSVNASTHHKILKFTLDSFGCFGFMFEPESGNMERLL